MRAGIPLPGARKARSNGQKGDRLDGGGSGTLTCSTALSLWVAGSACAGAAHESGQRRVAPETFNVAV